MKGSSRRGKPRLRQYTMVVVDDSGEHTTFCGTVTSGVSEEMICECFEKRFGADCMDYYFDWEDQWESGDLRAQLSFES